MRILVTGATGYIGSRLIPVLLDRGHDVLAASHREGGTDDYPWADRVRPVPFDMEDTDVVRSAVADADAVIYLVHSLDDEDFVERDREAAERVAAACAEAGVRRIVYLSGIVPDGELSDHLRSRAEVEAVFLDGRVPTTVLRAAMVVGAGSTSYELLARLSDRLPVIPVPSWMRSDLQPVAVEDVVTTIAHALEGEPHHRHFDLGGDEVLGYQALLRLYAEVAGLRRRQLVVPWVPTAVVGLVVAWLTRMQRTEVTSLIESLTHSMVCAEDDVRREVLPPDHTFVPLREALRRSLADREDGTRAHGDVQAAAPTDPA